MGYRQRTTIYEPHGEPISGRDSPGHTAEKTAPLVSVVIPCYNAARYLAESIESALGQTHPRMEVIVIDDGSRDETSVIAQSYPVTYVYQENRGISAARNAGIARSHGKYIVFLDHDDRLLPQGVATGVRLLEEHPECAVAVGEHRYIGADGRGLGYSNKRAVGRDHYLMLLQHNFIETPCSALHRRSSLGKGFDESVQGAEDHELYLRTARQSPFICHDLPVSEYRLHDVSTSRNAELMLAVSHRVMQMELPYIQGDREKLHLQREGLRFLERRFGRPLTRELIRERRLTTENRRKLKLLMRHYWVGFVAVVVSRFLPTRLTNALFAQKPQLRSMQTTA